MRTAANFLVSVALITAYTTFAGAQTDDAAVRREVISQAQQASASGDHARSADLATRAFQMQHSTSLRMFIAQEGSQRIVSPQRSSMHKSASAKSCVTPACMIARAFSL